MAVISNSSLCNRRALLGAGIGGAGLLATGCSIFDSTSGDGAEGGAGEQGPAITIARTSDIDSLDPHYVHSSMYILPPRTTDGLGLQDQAGPHVVPRPPRVLGRLRGRTDLHLPPPRGELVQRRSDQRR